MAKQKDEPVQADGQSDGKTAYVVAAGVTFAAGRKVSPGDPLRLTPEEALYEDALGRLVKPASPAPVQDAETPAGEGA